MSVYAQLLPAAAKLLLVVRDLGVTDRDSLMANAGIASRRHYYAAMRQLEELHLLAALPRWSALSTAQRGAAEAQRGDWREDQRSDRQDRSEGLDFLETHISIYDDRGARKTTGRGPVEPQSGPTEPHASKRSGPTEPQVLPTEPHSGPVEPHRGPVEPLDDDDSSLYEVLESRCQDADEMEASGEWSIRNSPRNQRRKAQVAVLKELWAHLFPEANPIIDTNVKAFLGKCGDSAYEVAQVWVTVQRFKPQNPLTYGLKVATTQAEKQAAQSPSQDPFDEKHDLTEEELEEIRRVKRVAAQLWGEDETW